MSHFENTIVFAFVMWLVLSALFQVNTISPKLGRFDPFGLLPKWTFFAPNPGVFDYHVAYRFSKKPYPDGESDMVSHDDEDYGQWQQLTELVREQHVPLFWNPARRVSKTLSDIVNGITRHRNADPKFEEHMMYSIEYVWLTYMVSKQIEPNYIYQWAIVRTHGFVDQRKISIINFSKHHFAEMLI